MKLFIRCAILVIAALSLVGCQSNNRPHKLGVISKAGKASSWRQNYHSGEGMHSPEPARASWDRDEPVMQSVKRRSPSIRQMAQRLAPAGANVSSLSNMVGKRRQAKIGCIPSNLRMILNTVAWHYGKRVHIQSGYRSKHHNRRVGGARGSYHVRCQAVDIQVSGISKYRLAKFLKTLPGRGGVGTYCNKSTVHIDVGRKRTWYYGCPKKSKRRYARHGKRSRS